MAHIDNITCKARQKLNLLNKVKYCFNRKTIETLYFTFVRPLLEYSPPLFRNCNKTQVQSLENFQLKAARIVTGAIKSTSHNSLYTESNRETLKSRRLRRKLE